MMQSPPNAWNVSRLAVVSAVALSVVIPLAQRNTPLAADHWQMTAPNQAMLKKAEELVRVWITPAFDFSFARMRPGVLQHLDRQYTYDVVPPELIDGLLFQGIHRPPKGTRVAFRLRAPATVYYFFHHKVDGGYSSIFAHLDGWERSAAFPQYDIDNGDHGLKMVMYRLDAEAGFYAIPATTKDRACFSIVFQPRPAASGSVSTETDDAAGISNRAQSTQYPTER